APGAMARGVLEADDPVAHRGVPARPGLASVLEECQRGVVPVVEVALAAVRFIAKQILGGLGAGRPRPSDLEELATDPGLGGHGWGDRFPGLITRQAAGPTQ